MIPLDFLFVNGFFVFTDQKCGTKPRDIKTAAPGLMPRSRVFARKERL